MVHPDTRKYNASLKTNDRAICTRLARVIDRHLKGAENRVWHAHPVWFLDGNPIVGYSKLKDCIRLLFWSGQSFKEEGLAREGSFKAAEVRYTHVGQIRTSDLKRWLTKARKIQWDYKNIVRRKGRLVRIPLIVGTSFKNGITIGFTGKEINRRVCQEDAEDARHGALLPPSCILGSSHLPCLP